MYHFQLETFISVAESGSFSKTAEQLYITPTAVMKQINSLEEQIGVILFVRTNHGLSLTQAGQSFLQDAKYLVDYSRRAILKAKEIGDQEQNKTIRIGTSIMTPAKFLLDVWPQIQERDHNLKIELIPFENNPINSIEILKNLGKHIDIVFGLYDDRFLEERGCKAAHLYDKKLMFALPVNHALYRKEKISMDDLKGRQVMLIRKNWNQYIDELRKDLISNGTQILDFEMFNIKAFNIASTNNIPIITVEGWEDVHPLLKIIPADWDYRIPFGILYSPKPTKRVRDFIDILMEIDFQKEE